MTISEESMGWGGRGGLERIKVRFFISVQL